jgi:hypothetical protein
MYEYLLCCMVEWGLFVLYSLLGLASYYYLGILFLKYPFHLFLQRPAGLLVNWLDTALQ